MIYLYRRTNIKTNKFYIGQTSQTPEKRWKAEEREPSYLGNSLRKYGSKNFINKIILIVEDRKWANHYEYKLINLYNLKIDGYNRRDGGNQGTISEKTRLKLSESHKGQVAWNKGIPLNEETKNKIRKTKKELGLKPMLGKHHSKETKEILRSKRIIFRFSEESKKRMSDSAKIGWKKRRQNGLLYK